MKKKDPYLQIISALKEKSTYKLEVLKHTKEQFELFNSVAEKLADELCKEMDCFESIEVKFTSKGQFQAELRFAEDVLIFFLHNDVFDFDRSHAIWKTSYVEKNRMNAYCGMISIFNFLKTSFDMNRSEDIGYLIGRVFINHEGHFFVDGKKQLGYLYNDFVNGQIDEKAMRNIIMNSILYCMDFDLLVPPFHNMRELKVAEMIDISNKMNIKTGKRLGFKFHAETDPVE